jgi:hypothetical protein
MHPKIKTKTRPPAKDNTARHGQELEDERGWAGQHGQRPANEEEKNYPPDPAKQDSQHE